MDLLAVCLSCLPPHLSAAAAQRAGGAAGPVLHRGGGGLCRRPQLPAQVGGWVGVDGRLRWRWSWL